MWKLASNPFGDHWDIQKWIYQKKTKNKTKQKQKQTHTKQTIKTKTNEQTKQQQQQAKHNNNNNNKTMIIETNKQTKTTCKQIGRYYPKIIHVIK